MLNKINNYNSIILTAKITVYEDIDVYILSQDPNQIMASTPGFVLSSSFSDNDFLNIDYGDGLLEEVKIETTGQRFIGLDTTVAFSGYKVNNQIKHNYAPGEYNIRIFGNIQILNALFLNNNTVSLSSDKLVVNYLYINSNCFCEKPHQYRYDIMNTPAEIYTCGFYINSKLDVEILDVGGDNKGLFIGSTGYYSGGGTVAENFNYVPHCVMPKQNEKFLLDLVSGTYEAQSEQSYNQYMTSSNMPFDRVGCANAIINSLNGQVLTTTPDTKAGKVEYQYQFSNNKVVSKVLISGTFTYRGYSSTSSFIYKTEFFKPFSFNTETNILKISNLSDGGSTMMSSRNAFYVWLKFIYTDGTFDVDYLIASSVNFTCFLQGTKITLADCTTKPVEEIKYSDLLLVYDFRTGSLKAQHPCFLKNKDICYRYLKFTLDNNKTFNIVGDHGVYDIKHKKLLWISEDNYKEYSDLEVMFREENGELKAHKVVSIELVEDGCRDYYTLITSGTQTCFTNSVLTCGNQFWQLIGNIDENNKFDMTLYNQIKNNKELQLSYDDYMQRYDVTDLKKGIYYGNVYDILLGAYLNTIDGNDRLAKERAEYQMKEGMVFWKDAQPFEQIDDTDIHYITFKYKNCIIDKREYKVGTVIDLPKTENGWYNVCDMNTCKDTLEVRVNTVLEEI